jgi:hypothetical protein
MPRSASDAGAVAVEGREAIPSRLLALPEVVGLPEVVALELVEAALFCVPLVSPCAVHVVLSSLVGDGPADVLTRKHADPDGVPPAPLPSEPFAEKSSEAEDGWAPQFVPRLASVGTPGDATAVEQVEAFVGSSADPIPASDPANEPVAVATAFARTRESEVETVVRLASAFADGPDVVGAGADPSGADGLDCDAVVGAVARVPGPVAEVEPREGAYGPVVFELDAVIGSLDTTVAGPALPPFAEADPPAVELCVSGRTSGCAERAGPSARARCPHTLRRAITAMSSSTFLIS